MGVVGLKFLRIRIEYIRVSKTFFEENVELIVVFNKMRVSKMFDLQ